jgi:hypothetical protein
MRRVQFIELHEQPWFPPSLRHEITDALQFGLNLLKAYAPIAPLLQTMLDSARCRSIVDVCSGGGGPWLDLSRKLQPDGHVFQILLTDKYPNLWAFQNVIGIFEITRRAPSTISLMFAWALMTFVFTPLIRPFRWSRLLCTYVFPIIPLVLLFDGVVSCLRTYRPQELREIVKKLSGIEYQWEVGEYSRASGQVPITYLIGYPQVRVSSS